MVTMGRETSDETYVLDLCDEVLGAPGQRQARFSWLTGDLGRDGRARTLPVDSYWPQLDLVVEYREIQHDRPVKHFDKPDQLTVSGVHRGLQRALYDQRRDEQIPAHGIRLVVIKPAELTSNRQGRLLRHRHEDLRSLRARLAG